MIGNEIARFLFSGIEDKKASIKKLRLFKSCF